MPEASERVLVAGVTRIEESDMVDAYRVVPVAGSIRGIVILAVVAAVSLVSLIARVVLGGLSELSPMHLMFTMVFAILCGMLVRGRMFGGKRAWEAMQEWQRQVRYEFSDTVLRVRTERSSNELDWGLHTAWLESPTGFYVQQQGSQYIVIPKRAFEGDAEVAQVRELLRAKVHAAPLAKKKKGAARKTVLLWLLLVAMCVVLYNVFTTNPGGR